MTPFTERVLEVIRSIPEGKVMTYGQVAHEAGSPRAARQVVRILHAMSRKHRLPWHRVLNVRGQIAIQDDEGAQLQRFLLESEDVHVTDELTVSLADYQAQPEEG
ncbi:DNA methyltransferase [Paenibacillus pectinilyticus]|uniref:DNA methyltransferase n=1 Tax=Paenibacillus pectinilyticus TaxID=512399 RepID=A0A1C1A4Y1_9BACL|nr:methylated-DNA--[protein]-cysteine S-methyltransferase [Paenibacillus pectinilyticus]OCT15623.1 DNA methyltransferase [Paenibacillus pectinilyticus]